MNTQNILSNEPILDYNKHHLETRYKNSRMNLLLVVAFSVINTILLVTQSDSYFLFSASIPYILVSVGMLLCGMYPVEYYGEDLSFMEFFDTSVFAIFLGIALVILALYLVSWIFSSKNRVGWLIFALVFFAIDTLVLVAFMGFSVDNILDFVFHAWVIISLSLGIHAGCKLKKLSAVETSDSDVEMTGADWQYASNLGHTVTYRRVKRVNELVVDGRVYDEMEALVEYAHALKAEIDGHLIEVGFDGKMHSYLKIDGETIAKKLRLS